MTVLSTVAAAAPVAWSQSQAGDSATNSASTGEELGQIVVTATHRAESLMTVPMSISAISSDALEKKAASSFFDYAVTVPNLSFANASYGVVDARIIGIRGIQDVGTTGFYIDDTPVPEALDPLIVDLNRVEVLRGPQGTLYGARSMGGTVRLITNQPDLHDFSANAHAGASDSDHTSQPNDAFDGTLNIPLIADTVALRIVAAHQYDAGYIKREFPTAQGDQTIHNVGAKTTDGFEVALLVKPAENLSITPRVLYQSTNYNGFPYVDVAVPNPLQSTVLNPTSLTVQREFNIPERAHDRWTLGTFDIKLRESFGTFSSDSSYFTRQIFNIEDDSLAITDALGLPGTVPVAFTDLEYEEGITQEFRFISDFSGPIQMVSGLYYNKFRQDITFPATTVPQLVPVFGTSNVYSTYRPSLATEYAAYTEGTLNLNSHLSLTAGLRAFRTENRNQATTDGIANGGYTAFPPSGVSKNGVTPKFSAQYKFDDEAQVYATAANGFRPGGGSSPITASFCQAELASLGLTADDTAKFKSDSVWSYEIGSKMSLLEHTLTVSGAIYMIDWTDIQQNEVLQCGYIFRLNAGTARSKGGELELTARPVEGLQLGTGIGYTDARFTSGVPGGTFQSGARVPEVPKLTISATGDYSVPITSETNVFLHADYSYVGQSFSVVNAIQSPVSGDTVPRIRPSYDIANVRAGFAFDRYEVAAFAKNVANKIASLSDVEDLGIEAPGRARVAISHPRTLGIEMRVKF